uniref:Uncharacterized protein n=1 Tax=Rhizophora mucronata TaxID=61149 RepID=A0A2P2NSB0_RHIMU
MQTCRQAHACVHTHSDKHKKQSSGSFCWGNLTIGLHHWCD